MPSVTTRTIIDATPDEVWLVLVNFPAWELWNPFIRDIEGVALAGEKVKITVSPNYGVLNERINANSPDNMVADAVVVNKSSSFRPTITHYQPGRLLAWKHRSWLTGSYAQRFELAGVEEGGTTFTNIVEMSGVLVSMGWEMAVRPTYESGMQLMNEALKKQVENKEWHSAK